MKLRRVFFAAVIILVLSAAHATAMDRYQIGGGSRRDVPAADDPPPTAQQTRHAAPFQVYGRWWNLGVPGSVVESRNRAEGVDELVITPGASAGLQLFMDPNGSFIWKGDGKAIRGRWAESKDHLSVFLTNGYQGKTWRGYILRNKLYFDGPGGADRLVAY